MQERYNGKYCWYKQVRGHASWCHLKVVQAGEPASWLTKPDQKAVVIFSKAMDNTGTAIAEGIEQLAMMVTDMFRLEPKQVVYIEHTPPVDLIQFDESLPEDDVAKELEHIARRVFGPSEGTYERINFTAWRESFDRAQPRYTFHGPSWTPITSSEVARLVQELDQVNA